MGTVYRRRDVDQHAVVLLLVLVGLGSRVWVLHWLALGTAAAAVAAAYLYQWTSGFHGRAVGIIPAHFASTLFEGKPLVHIFGKPMIQMVMQISQLNSHAFYTWIHLKEVTVDLRISFRGPTGKKSSRPDACKRDSTGSSATGSSSSNFLVLGTLLLPGKLIPKAESQFSPSRVKVEDALGEGPAGRSPSHMAVGANKKSSNVGQIMDGTNVSKVEDVHVVRSVGVKKPRYFVDEGPSLTELSGYNAKRHEFDPEYNDAEQALDEMEFKETDSETDRELKLLVLCICVSRLDERKSRKEFILERNLLFPNPLEKDLTNEDMEVYHRYKVFMRFLSKEEHEALVRSVIEERKIRRRIQELHCCILVQCSNLRKKNHG